MKKVFQTSIVILIFLLNYNVYAQDFNSKPYTVSLSWIKENLSQSELKKVVPKDYELVSETTKMLVFEKSFSSRINDIKVLYENNKISMVVFTLHPSRIMDLLREIDELNYKNVDGFKKGYIEMQSYINENEPYELNWGANKKERILQGSVFEKKKK